MTVLSGLFANPGPRADAFDIGARVRACVDIMRSAAQAKRLTLRCEIDRDLPRPTVCDGLRVRQVVFNLLGNAIDSTERGWVSVCVEEAWDQPGMVAISITDTGQGMATAQLADARARANGEGGPALGLGLTVSGELARQMGGALTLTSERGKGTRVELRVPLIVEAEPIPSVIEIIDAVVVPLPQRLGRTGSVRTERRSRTPAGVSPPLPPGGSDRRQQG
ncbi:sensor histidine kinase [Tsuneonella sp. HG094]